MAQEVDTIDYVLSLRLHKSLAEVRGLSSLEVEEWRSFLEWEAVMAEFNNKRASRG